MAIYIARRTKAKEALTEWYIAIREQHWIKKIKKNDLV